jgi:predicted nucleotide-binding protein
MQKHKSYPRARFAAEVIEEAFNLMEVTPGNISLRSITKGSERWEFDSIEEFLAEYRNGWDSFHFYYSGTIDLDISGDFMGTSVQVQGRSRPEIERAFAVFERALAVSIVESIEDGPAVLKPKIFIGHGRSAAWRDLKDHLAEQQGYSVQAYETGTRSGHTIRDILSEMLQGASFALLVLTGEDEVESGGLRARQNVVHELGLFQGRLGFPRAIAVVEEGIELFSNMDGVQQIRFGKGEIRQSYGDVLATLRREFGDAR